MKVKPPKKDVHNNRTRFISEFLPRRPSFLAAIFIFGVFASMTVPAQRSDSTISSVPFAINPDAAIETPSGEKSEKVEKVEKKIEASEEAEPSDFVSENLIHAGDILDIDVLGSLEYDFRGETDGEGFLSSLPYLDVSIFALCRTEEELAAEIQTAYTKFLREPRILVRVIDRAARRPAVLLGAIRAPHRFQIQRPVRLNELIVMSGGITDKASGEIQIFRPAASSCAAHKKNQPASEFLKIKISDLIAGKFAANPMVRTGDVVTVEEASPVYVTGGVSAPQRILFRAGMTISRAVASAGGVSRNGNAAAVTIFRRQTSDTQLKIIEVDLEKVGKNLADDIAIEPHDIIEVAPTGRARNRRAPVLNLTELTGANAGKLPLRVVS